MADNAPIEKISIELGTSAEAAEKNIEKVTSALKKLQKVSETKFNFSSLNDSLKSFNSSSAKKIRDLSSALKTLEGMSKVNISSTVGRNITELAASLDLLEQKHIDNLERFGTAFRTLSGTSVSISNTLADRILDVVFAVDQISDDSLRRLERMCESLSQLRGINLQGFRGALNTARNQAAQTQNPVESHLVNRQQREGEQIGTLSDRLDLLGARFERVGAVAIRVFDGIAARVTRVRDALRESLGQNMNFNFSWANNVRQIQQYWQGVGRAITTNVGPALRVSLSLVGRLAQGVLNVAKNIAKWSFHTAVNAVKNIWNIMKKIASTALDVAKKLPSAFGKLTGISNIAKSVENLLKPLKSLGRIALYRAARTAIKFVTDALQQGAERAYFYAKQFGDATRYIADALDALSSKNFRMQNQLGAAWATLLATIQPILIQIISVVTRAAEVVTQFFAIMSGSGTYLKAKDYTKAWADETEKGASAAKEWKNQILGFDEINRLEAPSDTNSGSGNNDYTDYENMFEEAKVESRFADFFGKIREMIQQGRWGELGTLLSDKFNSLVTNFDWAGWGKKLGKGIQGAIDLAYNFLKSDGFRNLGRGLMEMLDNLGSQMDFNRLGRLSVRIRTAIWDIFYGAVEYLAEPGVARNLAMRMSDFIIGAMQELTEWIASLDPHKIATAIKEFFGGIKYNEIRDSFVELIKTAWNFAVELKNEIWNEETKQKVSDAISDFFGDLTWEDIWKTVKEKLSTVWGWVSEKFEEIWPKDKRDEFGQKVKNFIANALDSIDWKAIHNLLAYYLDVIVFGKETADRMWYNKGQYAGRDLIIGAETGIKMQQQAWEQSVSGYITDPLAEALYEMEKKASGSGKALSEGVKKAADDSKSSVGSMKAEINRDSSMIKSDMDKINSSTKTVSSSMQSMQSRSNNAMRNMASTTSSSSRSIVSSLGQVVAKARDAFNSLSSMSSAKFSATVTPGKIKRYATGGFIEDGLFTMNHGEIAGRFSNGQSVAANNEQIKDGIAAAVYGAFTRAFAETGGTGNEQHGDIVLKINDREFARATYPAYKAVAREKGISMISNFA